MFAGCASSECETCIEATFILTQSPLPQLCASMSAWRAKREAKCFTGLVEFCVSDGLLKIVLVLYNIHVYLKGCSYTLS